MNENEPKLEDLLTLWHTNFKGTYGDIAHRACLGVTFYIADAHTRPVREAILRVFEDYQAEVGQHFNWATNPQSGRWKRLKKGQHIKVNEKFSYWLIEPDAPPLKNAYLQPRDWLSDWPDDPFEFVFHNGARKTDAADIRFHILGRAEWQQDQGKATYLSIHYPITWFAGHEGSFPGRVLRWAEWLQPLHGYGSLVLTDAHRGESHELWEPIVQLARRFPGLDVADPMRHSSHAFDSIKGPDWVIVLSSDWADKLGGEASIRDALPEIFSLHPYEGGLLIRAGRAPQLGDTEAGLYPEHYRDLARLLRPIQVDKLLRGVHSETSHEEIMGQKVIKFDKDRYMNWLHRFDPGRKPY